MCTFARCSAAPTSADTLNRVAGVVPIARRGEPIGLKDAGRRGEVGLTIAVGQSGKGVAARIRRCRKKEKRDIK